MTDPISHVEAQAIPDQPVARILQELYRAFLHLNGDNFPTPYELGWSEMTAAKDFLSNSVVTRPTPAAADAQRFMVTSIKRMAGLVSLCTLNAEDVLPPLESGQVVMLVAASPAAAAGVPTETAWLVEYSGKMLAALGAQGANAGEAIQYLAVRAKGYGAGELMLHADPNRALRFARKQDAEAALTVYAGVSNQSPTWIGNYLSAQEHMWPDASPVAPVGAPTEDKPT